MKYLNRISGALVVFLLFQGWFVPMKAADASSQPPKISAEAAALIDVTSGRILYKKNADKKMRIASLTKTMTAIVAIESANLNDVVTVPKSAVGVAGSSIYLKQGERLTLEELLYGLMLRSGNDSAVAIAEHVGGSVPGFAFMMNEKAAMIGMTHTNFTNPHGLDDSNMHYSTAEDMVKLSAYALKNPEFQKIVSTKVKTISWEGEDWGRRLLNKNKLLFMYKGADGVKTGYTRLAKRCLASSATRDGRQLAVITLNAPDDWKDSMGLLDWGFSQFQPVKVVQKGEPVEPDVTIERKQDDLVFVTMNEFNYPLTEEEVPSIQSKVQLFERSAVPAMIGKHVGFLQIYLGGALIGKVPLTVQQTATGVQMNRHVPAFVNIVWEIMAGGILHA
ncbi:D-alanyl-D-alanine carboxypeptidase family protein [Brevibacillus sp. B_LB10_24]|uniref:D-alanyl-D-alanine carboxypeptidase family protein n=1 Tax=Brevibacillus sp. B_LB10_24 TaxID=3380645 RepID=UPI0038BBB04B